MGKLFGVRQDLYRSTRSESRARGASTEHMPPTATSQCQAITEWRSVYVALDGKLMAVPIEFDATGKTVEAGTPVALFDTHIGAWSNPPITFLLNWKPK